MVMDLDDEREYREDSSSPVETSSPKGGIRMETYSGVQMRGQGGSFQSRSFAQSSASSFIQTPSGARPKQPERGSDEHWSRREDRGQPSQYISRSRSMGHQLDRTQSDTSIQAGRTRARDVTHNRQSYTNIVRRPHNPEYFAEVVNEGKKQVSMYLENLDVDLEEQQFGGHRGEAVDALRVPLDRVYQFQDETWFKELPPAVQTQLRYTPNIEEELYFECVSVHPKGTNGISAQAYLTANLAHTGYAPMLQQHYTIVNSSWLVAEAIAVLREAPEMSDGKQHFAMDTEMCNFRLPTALKKKVLLEKQQKEVFLQNNARRVGYEVKRKTIREAGGNPDEVPVPEFLPEVRLEDIELSVDDMLYWTGHSGQSFGFWMWTRTIRKSLGSYHIGRIIRGRTTILC